MIDMHGHVVYSMYVGILIIDTTHNLFLLQNRIYFKIWKVNS